MKGKGGTLSYMSGRIKKVFKIQETNLEIKKKMRSYRNLCLPVLMKGIQRVVQTRLNQ